MDSLSKCVVEMAKREWPQCWPTFWDECFALVNKGVLYNF